MIRFPVAAVLALVAMHLSGLHLPAQEPPDEPAPTPQEKDGKLEAWPELDPVQVRRIPGLLAQFRKKDESLHSEAHAELVALGDGAAPLLLARLTDNEVNFNDPILAVLDEVLGPRHADLLAPEARSRKLVERRYVLRRLATFADPDLEPVFAAALEDEDEDVAFYAALGASGLGGLESLEIVLQRCRRSWDEERAMISEVLENARSIDSGRWVLQRLVKGDTGEKIAGLRMARYLAPRELARVVAIHLDDSQHSVKKEAINALRVIHGQEPMENLSVFQAIEMAKEWKARI